MLNFVINITAFFASKYNHMSSIGPEHYRRRVVVTSLSSIDVCVLAGRQTTNEELEDMLESGNPAIFTQGVSGY